MYNTGMESQKSSADRYRQEAARIRSEAARARDEKVRETLVDIARQYEQLAVAAQKEPPTRLG
jgi:hypothetical protein